MASIKLIYREDKINAKGVAPLYIRIIKNRRTRFISTGIMLEPRFWDDENIKVRKSYPNSQRMNAFIAHKLAEAQGTILELETKNKDVPTKKLKQAIMGKEPENFFEYAYERLDACKKNYSIGTYENYLNYLVKLEAFHGSRNLFFDEIDYAFLKQYEKWMTNERDNKLRTVEYSTRIIKKYFREAIAEDMISPGIYPFLKYKVKFPKAKKDYLSEEQFEEFKTYEVQDAFKYPAYKDMFVFACYAGGLRYSDVIDLQWEDYDAAEQRITKIIHKTGRKHRFKIPGPAAEIIEKYRTKDSKSTDHIFPVLRNDVDYDKNPRLFYSDKRRAMKLVNHCLKTIGKKLEIPFPTSFHCSRHTFATRALNRGMRIEHVSKFMDHTDISITQVYAKIVDTELDKAIEVLE